MEKLRFVASQEDDVDAEAARGNRAASNDREKDEKDAAVPCDAVSGAFVSSDDRTPTKASSAVPAIEARAFSFSYPDGAVTFGPLDWQVEQGAFQLVVGDTGSGKTTLLRSLKPAIAPVGQRSGMLSVFGCSLGAMDASTAASAVGYVSQSPENQMVCDTVWHELAFGLENLGVAQDAMRRRVAEVAHFFGIEPWFHRAVAELSGGQKQMVNLAAVLAMQPRLLLLDEPTAQLDPVAEKNFLHALFRINRELGITVVVATHAPEAMAGYATGAVRLDHGRVQKASLDCFASRALHLVGREPQGGPCVKSASVALRDACMRYARESAWVLRGCDLAVGRGEIHAIVGGNGCGKSTLLRVIAGALSCERGHVVNSLADRQALLPQDPQALFVCDTVIDELREWQSGCGYGDAAIEDMLAYTGLKGHVAHHPYDLSGGQQQKLALAKLLLTDPALLLLDEPTKGLDASSKRAVADVLIERSGRGMTMVMATHDLAFAALVADRVTMLFDGQDTCTEPAVAFFAGNLFYRPFEDGFTRTWRYGRVGHGERGIS